MGCLQNWLTPLIRERKIAFSYGYQLVAIDISILNRLAEKSANFMGLAEN
ncbi:hypothetical protein [Apilactobacillus micheneri]|nr:hypothetical protein [Apilactobacillus micheneri]